MKKFLLCLPENFTIHAEALIRELHKDRCRPVNPHRTSQLRLMEKYRSIVILDESTVASKLMSIKIEEISRV
jgi:hypothetical protein